MRALVLLMLLVASPALAGPCDRWVFKGYDQEAMRNARGTVSVYDYYVARGDFDQAVNTLRALLMQAEVNPSSTATGICEMGKDPVALLKTARAYANTPTRPAPRPPRPMVCTPVAGTLSCI